MNAVTLTIPHDFDRWALVRRLRWWAAAYARLSAPNVRVISDLEDAATELDLLATERGQSRL